MTMMQGIETTRFNPGHVNGFARLWPQKGTKPPKNNVRVFAEYLWKVGGRVDGKSDLDWQEAEATLEELRPSLVMEAGAEPEALGDRLCRLQTSKGVSEAAVTVVAALDGAPEFRRQCFEDVLKKGTKRQDSIALIEAKDGRFYRFCYHVFQLHGACILDQTTKDANETPEQTRTYQDACVGAFDGQDALFKAIRASIDLHRTFAAYNEESDCRWQDRVHARIVLAGSFGVNAAFLPYVSRGELGIGKSCWDKLPTVQQQLLLAVGVRIGAG